MHSDSNLDANKYDSASKSLVNILNSTGKNILIIKCHLFQPTCLSPSKSVVNILNNTGKNILIVKWHLFQPMCLNPMPRK
jgi:hypothetical protein